MAGETSTLIHLVKIAIYFMIITPFHFYCILQFVTHFNEIYFAKRRQYLTFIALVFSYLFSFWPILIEPGSSFNLFGNIKYQTNWNVYFIVSLFYIAGLICVCVSRYGHLTCHPSCNSCYLVLFFLDCVCWSFFVLCTACMSWS